jgi:hypothetical protein
MKETRKSRHDQTAINKKTKQTLLSRYGVDAASRINLSEKTANILYYPQKLRLKTYQDLLFSTDLPGNQNSIIGHLIYQEMEMK